MPYLKMVTFAWKGYPSKHDPVDASVTVRVSESKAWFDR